MDLNMMMREQARAGLQAQLDRAVTDGDTAAATKIADDIAKLALSTAPKALAYGADDIKAEMDKLPWFGVDAKKSARAMELGKHMDPKKFASAELFAAALVKAVEDDMKPASTAAADDGDDEEAEEDEETEDDEEDEKKPAPRRKRTDGPRDGDNPGGSGTRAASRGPWTKMSDAPADVQKEIKRSEGKFLSSNASKEQRETFVKKALESHYQTHQRNKGKR
jgi:hypothetical protein